MIAKQSKIGKTRDKWFLFNQPCRHGRIVTIIYIICNWLPRRLLFVFSFCFLPFVGSLCATNLGFGWRIRRVSLILSFLGLFFGGGRWTIVTFCRFMFLRFCCFFTCLILLCVLLGRRSWCYCCCSVLIYAFFCRVVKSSIWELRSVRRNQY